MAAKAASAELNPLINEKASNGANGASGDAVANEHSLDIKYPEPPADSFRLVYLIFFLHGLAVLMPWNVCITIQFPYFTMFKLGDDYVSTTSQDEKDALAATRSNFPDMMNIIAQTFNFVLCLVNTFSRFGKSTIGIRIVGSIVVIVISLLVYIVMAIVDTSQNYMVYVVITLVGIVFMNAAVGIYQNVVFGLVAILPMKYMGAIILGNNVAGLFCAVMSILTKLFAGDTRVSTVFYFLSAICIQLIAFDSYFALPLLKYYRHFEAIRNREEDNAEGANEQLSASENIMVILRKFKLVWLRIWRHLLDIFFTFFVTLCVYPGLFLSVKPLPDEDIFQGYNNNGQTDVSKFYLDYAVFLNFSVFVVLGNTLTSWFQKPGPKWLWVLVYGRFAFLLVMPMVNSLPCTRACGVWFGSGWWPIAFNILFSLTHGYCSSLAMMYAPKQIEPAYQGYTGMLSGVFLIAGIITGLQATVVVKKIMEAGGPLGAHCNIVAGNNLDYYGCNCNGTAT